jgi:RHS repeat-associated protein
VERLGYWIDERYLGCYSRWVSCGVVELPGGLRHCTSFASGVACSLGLVEEGSVGLSSGARRYELSDWLGNVRVVVTDQRIPIRGNNQVVVGYRAEVVDVRDYYSYGLDISERSYGSPIHPYRYSFNGKEDLREQRWYQDYGARFYHKALGRFVSADPLIVSQKKYAWLSSYQFASSSPVWAVDLDGLEMFVVHGTLQERHSFSEGILSQLKRIAGNREVDTSFSWGGGITFERIRGEKAKKLVDHILRKRAEMLRAGKISEDEPITIVGYSHGGNIALQAARLLGEEYWTQVNVITIATPAYNGEGEVESPSNNPGIYQHYHFVHENDWVVRLAGGDLEYSSFMTHNYVIKASECELSGPTSPHIHIQWHPKFKEYLSKVAPMDKAPSPRHLDEALEEKGLIKNDEDGKR